MVEQAGSRQSMGGKARAASLTSEKKKEIGRKGAEKRWALERLPAEQVHKAAVTGTLQIGESKLQCAVLDDAQNTRVLTQSTFLTALGRFPTPPSHSREDLLVNLPAFLRAKNLEPFISNELISSSTPMVFEAAWGGGHKGRSLGFRAHMLPEVCWVYQNALMAGALVPAQKHVAAQCAVLLRGLTNVAIDALVDEATGWQYLRDRNELQKLLALYVAPELMPWNERFPMDFYKEMFRLWNWPWPPKQGYKGPQGPRYASKLTNKIVYDQLPEGVMDDIRKKNPPDDNWQRREKNHQWLSGDIGQPHLEKQVAVATNIMKVCDDKEEFQQKFERAFPGTFEKGRQLSFTKDLLKPES